ncbi:hypothetical protein ACWCO3_33200 [Micromonospora sp. NPDC002411]
MGCSEGNVKAQTARALAAVRPGFGNCSPPWNRPRPCLP